MKAKDLISILEQNPQSEVVFFDSDQHETFTVDICEGKLIRMKPSTLLESIKTFNPKVPESELKKEAKEKGLFRWAYMLPEFDGFLKTKKNLLYKKVFVITTKNIKN